MNRLSTDKRAQVIGCLVEGMSIRGTVRVTGVAKNTIAALLTDLGDACSAYQHHTLVNLDTQRVECDEIWSFCQAKARNVPEAYKDEFGWGDVWTWTAIDADTKLIPCWYVGDRSTESAAAMMFDLSFRLTQRVQLTTDGHAAYLGAVEAAFGGDVEYAMLVKISADGPEATPERRYSPAVCTGAEKRPIVGAPEEGLISTSYVERQNLTMRMGMRRFTRLTNGFSRKVENHAAAVSLHFMYYNFARPHQTLTKRNGGRRTTPAMAAGKADHVWTMTEIAALLDTPGYRGAPKAG